MTTGAGGHAASGPDARPFAGRKDSEEGTLSVSDALRAPCCRRRRNAFGP